MKTIEQVKAERSMIELNILNMLREFRKNNPDCYLTGEFGEVSETHVSKTVFIRPFVKIQLNIVE